jgi:cytochrome c-type protein NapC
MKHSTLLAASVAIAASIAIAVAAEPALAAGPDWSKVPVTKMVAFQPGVTSLEWALTLSNHSGARGLKWSKACAECHDEEAAEIGRKIASGAKAEPAPIKGKAGSIPISVQAAHDGTNLYLRVRWEAPPPSGVKQDEKNHVKVAVMFDPDVLEYGKLGGCWVSCHHDLRGMPDVNKDAAKSPRAKELNIQADGPTKYLKESRTALELRKPPRGGWDKAKSSAEIEALLRSGKFIDIMQFRSGEKSRDGYVLDARHMKEVPGRAEGNFSNGIWTVTFTRKLASEGPGDHAIVPGKTYTFGIALHDDWANQRYHHATFGYTMALDDPKVRLNVVKL